MKNRIFAGSLAIALFSFLPASSFAGVFYYGNQYSPDDPYNTGGAVGGGALEVSDRNGNVNVTFHRGSGQINNNIVIYIDSVPLGFANTTSFSDTADIWQKSISGYNGSGRSTIDFASGFTADYAIAINLDRGGCLFKLAAGSAGSLINLGDVHFSPTGDHWTSTYTFSFALSDVGITSLSSQPLKFESTYVYDTGNLYNETFESYTSDSSFGFGREAWFTRYDSYPLQPVPETSNLALSVFGGLVVGAGFVSRARHFFRTQKVPAKTPR